MLIVVLFTGLLEVLNSFDIFIAHSACSVVGLVVDIEAVKLLYFLGVARRDHIHFLHRACSIFGLVVESKP